ncbi:hypothetical protein [Pseudorhizobium tarimense]|uniref:hypothetical protein n=1 Tax=Pseudorhizobium tarimense TaxID=1079109 RepID=UPI001FF60CC5|nr:hypothetical protein [Pseudorhizobium tarimense]MCJ8520466.1 hypothetical protein [Pseudorhizobium tarimense]
MGLADRAALEAGVVKGVEAAAKLGEAPERGEQSLMFFYLEHTLRIGGYKTHPRVVQVAFSKKGGAACLDSVPIGLARSNRQARLKVLKASAGSKNGCVQKVAVTHKDRMLPVKLEANLNHRTHGGFLSVHPREDLTGEQPYHNVKSRALPKSAYEGMS